jgi:hypothetical protein
MKVNLVGKQHIQGVSKKTGNPYDNTIVHVTYPESGIDGNAVDRVFLDAKVFPVESLVVGATYDLEYNRRGFVAGFNPCK